MRRSVWNIGALALALLFAAGCTQSVPPPPSPPPPSTTAPPALPVSLVDVPIDVDLELLRQRLEREVPKEIDHEKSWERSGSKGLRYRVERGPIEVGFREGKLHVGAELRYRARACVGVGRWCQKVASCGYGKDGMRRAELTLSTPLSISPNWNLQTKTEASHRFVDPCKITFLRVDIRKQLDRTLEKKLPEVTKALDAELAKRAKVRERAQEAWEKVQRPIELHDGMWLVLAPEAVRLTPARGKGRHVRFSLGMTAKPRLVGGTRPEVEQRPLPALQRVAEGEGFSIFVQAQLPYDEATRHLREQVVGKHIDAGGHRTVIHDVEVFGSADGVRLRLDVEAKRGFFRKVRGTVDVVARPTWDPETGTLALENLDYTLATQDAMAQAAEYLLRPDILEALRAEARWKLGDRIEDARAIATRELVREIAPGVQLRGQLDRLEPLSVVAAADGFVASVAAVGSAGLSFGPAS